MNRLMHKKIIELTAVLALFVFMTGCKTGPSEITTHTESGKYKDMVMEIFDECVANEDYEGAKEVLDTDIHLAAFCCGWWTEVKYDDVKNRNFDNIQYDIGELQMAVAAYNEYNDEAAMDVEVDWICQYNSCTQEQRDAIEGYVEWYHNRQNGNKERTIDSYTHDVGVAYNEICIKFDLEQHVAYDNLSPAQFKEVQNYMADPNYQVDTSLWE